MLGYTELSEKKINLNQMLRDSKLAASSEYFTYSLWGLGILIGIVLLTSRKGT